MMDKRDLTIISHLRKDARESLTHMSRKTAIPVSTIFDRMKANAGDIIQGYTTLLDFARLGYNARCKIIMKVNREQRDTIEQFLLSHQNVNSLYKINNGFDFLMDGVFKNIKDCEDFLETLETKHNVKNKQVYYIIDDVKRESFMADPVWVDKFGV